MSADWIDMELGEFAELKRGYDLPKREREIGIIPLVSSSGTTDLHSVAKVKGPGVITGRYGTIGQVFYVEEDFWPLNTTLYVQSFKNNNPLFVYYLLKTISYEDYSDKAAVPGINRNHLHKAKVRVPVNPSHQQEIAEKLWVLDSKIELNRQTNQTLEQIAQAIFKSWFVDFEPTRAKIIAKAQGADPATQELAAQAIICGAISLEQLQGYVEESVQKSAQQREQESLSTRLQKAINEKLSQASANPLNAITAEQVIATAALLPNALVESELGGIPVGWSAGSFKDLCVKVESGGTPRRNTPEYWGGEIKWLASGEVRDVVVLDTKEKITESGLENSAAKLWPMYTTIVAMYGATAGQVCLIADQMTSNQACCGLIPKNNYRAFTFFSAKRSIESLSDKASGSAQQNLNKGIVEGHPTILPAEALLAAYETLAFPLILKWIENMRESVILAELRDTLLPKLLSGEIDVSALADNTEANA